MNLEYQFRFSEIEIPHENPKMKMNLIPDKRTLHENEDKLDSRI